MYDIHNIEKMRKVRIEILENIRAAAVSCGRNPDEIFIAAVAKTNPADAVVEAIEAGFDIIAENYAQEIKDKYAQVGQLIEKRAQWHFIGHLQTNKVKYLAPFVGMIHSVDSLKLAQEIDRQAERFGRKIDILLQVNTSGEESKSGCEPDELLEIAQNVLSLKNIEVKGLMTIGTFSSDETLIRKEFSMLRNLKSDIEKLLGIQWQHLSMGMTHDYEIAVSEGATIVRIGTAVFGTRNYIK